MICFAKRLYLNVTRQIATSCVLCENRELWRLDKINPFLVVSEAWITSLSDIVEEKKTIINLHPGNKLIFFCLKIIYYFRCISSFASH